jgi:hypothetical protein
MASGYHSRTGQRLSREDVANLTKALTISNQYYYALAQSMLLSWDSGQYKTTKEFDRLYLQMEQDGGRKPEKLQNDKNRIRLSAEHQPVETGEGGIQYELSRDSILHSMKQIEIAMDNGSKIISALTDMAQ